MGLAIHKDMYQSYTKNTGWFSSYRQFAIEKPQYIRTKNCDVCIVFCSYVLRFFDRKLSVAREPPCTKLPFSEMCASYSYSGRIFHLSRLGFSSTPSVLSILCY